ncbi:MAG: hypothetical protein K0S76_176 [Herbinix sp.]|jgi:hypothetical protein|nr:hypothetical protein [Herbinix sp.]
MTNPDFFQKIVDSIVTSIKSVVNRYVYNRLQEDGRFDASRAYYEMNEYGYKSLDEYTHNTFFGSLFSRKASF